MMFWLRRKRQTLTDRSKLTPPFDSACQKTYVLVKTRSFYAHFNTIYSKKHQFIIITIYCSAGSYAEPAPFYYNIFCELSMHSRHDVSERGHFYSKKVPAQHMTLLTSNWCQFGVEFALDCFMKPGPELPLAVDWEIIAGASCWLWT